jgi:cytochrome b561
MSGSDTQKYTIFMRVLHWVMAIIILGLIVFGFWMEDLPKDYPDKGYIYGLHKSFGVLILILFILRVIVRLCSKIPPLPRTIPIKIHKFSHIAHYLLYILMFIVPVIGYFMSNSFGYSVGLFGINLPDIFPEDKPLGRLIHDWHGYFAYTLLAIVILHVIGALKHRFFEAPENDVLKRML